MFRSCSSFRFLVFAAFALCAAGQGETVFASCGDYLQHEGQIFATSNETESFASGERPTGFPTKCARGRCGNDPENSPLGNSETEFRSRIRSLSAIHDLLGFVESEIESKRRLPHSDFPPESVVLDRPDPPPRFSLAQRNRFARG